MLHLTSLSVYNPPNRFLTGRFESLECKVDLNNRRIQKSGKIENIKAA